NVWQTDRDACPQQGSDVIGPVDEEPLLALLADRDDDSLLTLLAVGPQQQKRNEDARLGLQNRALDRDGSLSVGRMMARLRALHGGASTKGFTPELHQTLCSLA